MIMPLVELRYILRQSVSKETSLTPDRWSPESPFYGHCAAFCVIVQDHFGGRIQRGLLPSGWPEKLGFRTHYWNVLDDGSGVDLSQEQFPPDFPYDDFVCGRMGGVSDAADKREYIPKPENTRSRYEVLRERIKHFLDLNPLFGEKKFQRCWELAFSGKAKCAKMRFACLVFDGEEMIAEEVNRFMTEQFCRERFCGFDGSYCVQTGIKHRMDASVGDCGHAPIWCLKNIFESGYPPSFLPRLDFYEVGFYPDGSPWQRKESDYTCIYCENMFAVFGLDKIWGVFDGKWQKFWTRDSFYTSAEYALGKKRV